jgi:hypothetical protein
MSQNSDFYVTGGQELFPGIQPRGRENMTVGVQKHDTGVYFRGGSVGQRDNGLQ